MKTSLTTALEELLTESTTTNGPVEMHYPHPHATVTFEQED